MPPIVPRLAKNALIAALALGSLPVLTSSSALAASFPVSNTNNSGPGSLRSAIDLANASGGPDSIELPPGTYGLTGNGDDTNATGDLDITGSLTINGASAASTTIDPNRNDRALDILGATTAVTLNGLTLTDGNNQSGAAIRSVGSTLNFNGVSLNANTAGGAGVPGTAPIQFDPSVNGSITIAGMTATDNHAGGGGGGGSGSAGLFYMSSSTRLEMSIANSNLSGNTAGGGGAPASAGVIYMSPGGAGLGAGLTMTNVKVEGNRGGGGGAGGSASSGAVYISSGGPHEVTIAGCTFIDNHAGGDGAPASAGAIYSSPGPAGGSLNVSGTKVEGNTAGGGGPGGSGTSGGVYMSSGGPHQVAFTNSTIIDNHAGGGGAPASAGGVYSSPGGLGGSLTFANTKVEDNSAGGGGAAASGTSGGVYFSSGGPHTLSFDSSSVSNNRAGGDDSPAAAGGVYNSPGGGAAGSVSITNTKIDGNKAGGGGPGGDATTGGFYHSTGGSAPLNIDRSSIANNAAGGEGGQASGGGVYYSPGAGGVINVTNATITGNKSGLDSPGGVGGGLRLQAGSATIINTTIANNTAGTTVGLGGGIYRGGAAVTLKNTIVAGNSAPTGTNCETAITSAGHNLESADTCGLNAAGDLKNTNPQLGPYGNYGGPTNTLNLIKGSPAINAGDNNGCPATDQRGGTRTLPGGTCDIGAYEYGGLADLKMAVDLKPNPASAGTNLTYTLTATNAGPSPDDAAGVNVADSIPAGATFVSAKASQGSCSGKAQVACPIGTLASGAAAKVTVVVKPKHQGTAINGASVGGAPVDPDPANGTVATSTKVLVGISSLRLRPRTFKAAGAGASLARRAGARVSYKLSDKATVTFRVQKPRIGRKSKSGKCGAKSKGNRGGKRCTYFKSVKGSFKKRSKAGTNRIRFTGRLRRHKLPAGKYRLAATAKGTTGNSVAATANFKIKR